MKILLVVESKHLGNTLKIAKSMAEVVPATIVNVKDAQNQNPSDYDIVGFGSGIYAGKHDKNLLDFVSQLDDDKKYTFVFSTSCGKDFEENNKTLIDLLKQKQKIVLDCFSCAAITKFFIFRLIGGLNKGLPNSDDYKNAQSFILKVVKEYEAKNNIN